MTTQGTQTKGLILDAAERLFAARGVAAVSLREIRIASGARNTAALQFHFHDRDGLIDALIARHMPRIGEIQDAYYERAVADERLDDARTLVGILVRPGADYSARGPSERAWVKIMADLGSLPDLHLKEMAYVTPETGLMAAGRLAKKLRETMPADVARERLIMLAQWAVHATADFARLADGVDDTRSHNSHQTFVENLVDVLTAGLQGPMSDDTAKARRRKSSPKR
jgi:AcrR family transcriptional regulator